MGSNTVLNILSLPIFVLEFFLRTFFWLFLPDQFLKLFPPAEEKQFFEPYLELPLEIRMMIIDRMGTEDRCRFSGSSRQSNKEAKSSKYFIHSLQLIACEENNISIYVTHKEYINEDDIDYVLKFEIANGRKWLKCVGQERSGKRCQEDFKQYLDYWLISDDEDLWVQELDMSTDLVQYAAEYFKKLLGEHQNRINHLNFFGEMFNSKLKNFDFGVENLASLEQLDIHGQMDVPFYLSKTRYPLDKLSVNGEVESDLTECAQIYQVHDFLDLTNTKFTYQQFIQLSALEVSIHIGNLTEIDIFNFIKLWQNGELGRDVDICEWQKLEESNFDVFELLKLLEHRPAYKAKRGFFEIENFKNVRIYGELRWYDKRSLRFEVRKRK